MTEFDWAALLKDHPVFEPLDEADRQALLDGATSVERRFKSGDIVLRQGTIGDSVLVIGKGRAAVMLERKDADPVTLYTVTRGELLGEMALFEDRPRAATVEATEDMVLLEIKGAPFLDLLNTRSDIALILLARLSRRLRYTDQKVLERRFSGLDETVTILNTRIDSALEAADSKLAASKTMFEQTNTRSNEIIASGQRANTALKLFVGLFAAVGGLGLWNLYDQREAVTEIRTELERDAALIEQKLAALDEKLDAAAIQLKEAQRASNRVHGILDRADVAKLVDRVKSQKLNDDTIDLMANALQHFDREVIDELSRALNGVAYQGKIYHAELDSVLSGGKLSDANGIVFLSYYLALSAINSPGTDFTRLKRALEDQIDDREGEVRRPRYVDGNTRGILKSMAQNIESPDVALEDRLRKIDELMDVMGELRSDI